MAFCIGCVSIFEKDDYKLPEFGISKYLDAWERWAGLSHSETDLGAVLELSGNTKTFVESWEIHKCHIKEHPKNTDFL